MTETDRTFDWRPSHDPRSRLWSARAAIAATGGPITRRIRRWREGPVLDQGREGACVGFGWTGEVMSTPVAVRLADPDTYARNLYRAAQRIDEWAGENYEGTSVLAGAKVVLGYGMIREYRWAFGIDDLIDTVCTLGPVVIGIPWLSGMYDTRPSGMVEVAGQVVGGHCVVVTGYHPGIRLAGEGWFARHEVLRWRNSWGTGYGLNGSAYVKAADLASQLAQSGEACVPMLRSFG